MCLLTVALGEGLKANEKEQKGEAGSGVETAGSAVHRGDGVRKPPVQCSASLPLEAYQGVCRLFDKRGLVCKTEFQKHSRLPRHLFFRESGEAMAAHAMDS